MTIRDHLLGWANAAQFIADSMPVPVKPCPVRLVPVAERVGVADVDPEPNPAKAATTTHAGFSIGDRIVVYRDHAMQEDVCAIGDAGRIVKLDPRDDTALVEFDASPTVSDGCAVLDGTAPRQWWVDIHSIRPEAAPAAALGDGWIEWGGGKKCPIPNADEGDYEIRWSDGSINKRGPATDWRWFHEAGVINLTAYRLIPTEAA